MLAKKGLTGAIIWNLKQYVFEVEIKCMFLMERVINLLNELLRVMAPWSVRQDVSWTQ